MNTEILTNFEEVFDNVDAGAGDIKEFPVHHHGYIAYYSIDTNLT